MIGVSHQVFQQGKKHRGQFDRLAPSRDPVCGQINREIAHTQHGCFLGAGPAEERAQASK